MVKILVMTAVSLGMVSAAAAADLPRRQPVMVEQAPIGKGPIGKGPVGKGPVGKGPVVGKGPGKAPAPVAVRG